MLSYAYILKNDQRTVHTANRVVADARLHAHHARVDRLIFGHLAGICFCLPLVVVYRPRRSGVGQPLCRVSDLEWRRGLGGGALGREAAVMVEMPINGRGA